MDFNKFIGRYQSDPFQAKLELVQTAARELATAVQEGLYDFSNLKDLNYSEICSWCGWPDFQDGGIFEQAINTAANMILGIMGYKSQH